MPPTYRDDPYGNYNFLIEVQGISDGATARGSFSEITGLGVDIDVIEYRVGTEDITVRKMPGLKKYPNLVCKRGVTGDATFWNWLLSALQGDVQRATVRISLLDESRQEVMRWNLRRAWPCAWRGPDLKAMGSEVAIESLELCHEGIDLDD